MNSALQTKSDDELMDRICVEEMIEKFHFPQDPRLFSMLAAGVLMKARNPNVRLTKDIYPALQKPFQCSINAADQALRRYLRDGWKNRTEHPTPWETYFPGCTECPSVGKFIRTIAAHLHKEHPTRFRMPL
ncbi:MAG: hypothetical protein J6J12_02585 [Oscillospiraceae bacterium]|nr:hypothetical protein [Oscillospiraceae bacterium]